MSRAKTNGASGWVVYPREDITTIGGYAITEEVDDDGASLLVLRDVGGCDIVHAKQQHGQWWLDGDVGGFAFRDIGLLSHDSAHELLMIIASLLPAQGSAQ
jgi:hypothetical protein